MTYDNNDGPIYSALSGKVLSSAPCTFQGTNTGSCPGYCHLENYGTTRFSTVNDALNECDNQAAHPEYSYNPNTDGPWTSGNCLGAYTTSLVGYYDSMGQTCEPNSPGCTAIYNLQYAICWS
jgi:hypothetical protein